MALSADLTAAARRYPHRAGVVVGFAGVFLADLWLFVGALRGHEWLLAFAWFQALVLIVAVLDANRSLWVTWGLLREVAGANRELAAESELLARALEGSQEESAWYRAEASRLSALLVRREGSPTPQ